MTRPLDSLPQETILNILAKIAPGSHLKSVELLAGSFSNHTHLLEASLQGGEHVKLVVRRYQVYANYNRGEKARREFKAFELIHEHGIPGPEPLLLDDTGALLGAPGIVTRCVPGALRLDAPSEPLAWARKLATMLAKIHAIPLDKAARSFLLEANGEATWFLQGQAAPEFMQKYPGGARLWQAIHASYPSLRPVRPALVHLDYWVGNVLWEAGEISAVLDWEEAACGDPVIDVAYARMNMCLMGLPDAADEFLQAYESESGRTAENLAIWEMAAAARPMLDPEAWEMGREEIAGRLQEFMEEAMKSPKSGDFGL
jgi:aminoglycoside phosphotransferase (APT) family kinase protein